MAMIEDPRKKIELLEEDIKTWKNLRSSEVAMNKDLKDKIKKLELSLEQVIGINETLLNRIIKLQDLLLK
tara:strand:+ start:1172 stop:1381 length:210 start_codon:yes stop_codon:yes gene_type:complete